MSLLGGLRNGRGGSLSASGAAPRRRLKKPSKDRLPADRLAAALGMLPITPPGEAPTQPAVWVPKRTSGVQALQVRLREGAAGGPAPVVSSPVAPPNVVSPPVVPDTGRHRGRAEQLEGWVQQPPSAAARHARASGGAHGETEPVRRAQRKPMPVVYASVPVVSAPVPPESGRHRAPAPPKQAILRLPVALRGARTTSHRLVVVGVLVLLVAVAVVFGVRLAVARPLAQPHLIATTAHGQLGGPATELGAVQLPPRRGVL